MCTTNCIDRTTDVPPLPEKEHLCCRRGLTVPPFAWVVLLAGIAGCARPSVAPTSATVEDAAASTHTSDATGTRSLKVQAVVVTVGKEPVKLPLMTIHGARLESLQTKVAAVVKEKMGAGEAIQSKLTALESTIKDSKVRVTEARAALVAAEEKVRAKWAGAIPQEKDAPKESSRSELDALLANRDQEDTANDDYKEAMAALQPIRDTLRLAQSDLRRQEDEHGHLVAKLRQALQLDSFDYLPPAERTWKTDTDGKVILTVPRGEPWILWATESRKVHESQEFYRWLMPIPESTPDMPVFYLDGKNMFSEHGIPDWLIRTPPDAR
jgi:hypothetical protein